MKKLAQNKLKVRKYPIYDKEKKRNHFFQVQKHESTGFVGYLWL
mgnify:CR=1 FL=1